MRLGSAGGLPLRGGAFQYVKERERGAGAVSWRGLPF